MTGTAVFPLVTVSAGEDREILGVMGNEVSLVSGRMTEIAILTVVGIPGYTAV